MTEQEWLVSDNTAAMLDSIQERADSRKLRLFACACCRRVWNYLPDARSRRAIDALESVVDDPPAQLQSIGVGQFGAAGSVSRTAASAAADPALASRHAAWAVIIAASNVTVLPATTSLAKAILAAGAVVEAAEGQWGGPPPGVVDEDELTAQRTLLRDIIGNPFRPVRLAATWRTSTALALARQMYQSRDFSAMPILADALQDAGCENEDVLNHCRQPGEHVRGCWVVDLLTGRG